ncbi:type VI secretion system tube protein TssD [Persicitalea jodogahamensis]|uniref:Uncharacterized protein n=1 Tax=Persicitalea jodogahamensis TaxID=402147 RepID=A0A8J3D0F7_9BACT|nr:type VI secretion system tube protein TssD [Persicitalea jodogahamensis]GHB52107.1 hypothetical protein GCM10007390_00910 [Persicitalea jodogahamensis]
MSFLAHLEIEGNTYEAFYTQLEAHQGVDDNGQTNTPVQCPYLYLELHLPPKNDLMLLEWALAASRPLDFKLKQYHDSPDIPFKTLEFERGYCVSYVEKFESLSEDVNRTRINQGYNMILCLTVTFGRMDLEDINLTNF